MQLHYAMWKWRSKPLLTESVKTVVAKCFTEKKVGRAHLHLQKLHTCRDKCQREHKAKGERESLYRFGCSTYGCGQLWKLHDPHFCHVAVLSVLPNFGFQWWFSKYSANSTRTADLVEHKTENGGPRLTLNYKTLKHRVLAESNKERRITFIVYIDVCFFFLTTPTIGCRHMGQVGPSGLLLMFSMHW